MGDDTFTGFVSDHVSLFLEINLTPDVPVSSVWEALGACLGGRVISFMAEKGRSSVSERRHLERQIAGLDGGGSRSPSQDLCGERLGLGAECGLLASHSAACLLLEGRSNIYE